MKGCDMPDQSESFIFLFLALLLKAVKIRQQHFILLLYRIWSWKPLIDY